MTLFMLKRVPSIQVLKRRKKMSLLWLESTVSPFTQEIMKIMFVVIFFSDQNLFLRDCKHYLNLILHAKRGILDLQRYLLNICVHRQILRYVYPHIYVHGHGGSLKISLTVPLIGIQTLDLSIKQGAKSQIGQILPDFLHLMITIQHRYFCT